MAQQARIGAILDAMDTLFADMATAVDARDLAKRQQMIALRRAIADQFVALNTAVEAGHAAGQVDPALVNAYHARFAAFRRALSLHQAEWPTVLIADNMARYVASSQALRRQREDFMAWMRAAFVPGVPL